jgi:hypothetical protein
MSHPEPAHVVSDRCPGSDKLPETQSRSVAVENVGSSKKNHGTGQVKFFSREKTQPSKESLITQSGFYLSVKKHFHLEKIDIPRKTGSGVRIKHCEVPLSQGNPAQMPSLLAHNDVKTLGFPHDKEPHGSFMQSQVTTNLEHFLRKTRANNVDEPIAIQNNFGDDRSEIDSVVDNGTCSVLGNVNDISESDQIQNTAHVEYEDSGRTSLEHSESDQGLSNDYDRRECFTFRGRLNLVWQY